MCRAIADGGRRCLGLHAHVARYGADMRRALAGAQKMRVSRRSSRLVSACSQLLESGFETLSMPEPEPAVPEIKAMEEEAVEEIIDLMEISVPSEWLRTVKALRERLVPGSRIETLLVERRAFEGAAWEVVADDARAGKTRIVERVAGARVEFDDGTTLDPSGRWTVTDGLGLFESEERGTIAVSEAGFIRETFRFTVELPGDARAEGERIAKAVAKPHAELLQALATSTATAGLPLAQAIAGLDDALAVRVASENRLNACADAAECSAQQMRELIDAAAPAGLAAERADNAAWVSVLQRGLTLLKGAPSSAQLDDELELRGSQLRMLLNERRLLNARAARVSA